VTAFQAFAADNERTDMLNTINTDKVTACLLQDSCNQYTQDLYRTSLSNELPTVPERYFLERSVYTNNNNKKKLCV